MNDDMISVTINTDALRQMVREEVRSALRALIETPIGAFASNAMASVRENRTATKPDYLRHAAPSQPWKGSSSVRSAPTRKPKAPKKPSTTTLGGSEGAQNRLIEILRAHPAGIRGAALRDALGWDKSFYSYHMKLAKDKKLFSVKGEKGGATYFLNLKAAEKHESANGIATETSSAN
jgi:hypothetical protein